jgi:hypothetical protein
MALTGIYNSNDREIVLTPFQAQIFNQTIEYFRTNGVGGDNVFEDTYVLQKRVAEYIKENATSSGGSASSFVTQIYNGVLGISPTTPAPPAPAPPAPADAAISAPSSPVFTTRGGGTASPYTSEIGGNILDNMSGGNVMNDYGSGVMQSTRN